jgi:hypothetical protein
VTVGAMAGFVVPPKTLYCSVSSSSFSSSSTIRGSVEVEAARRLETNLRCLGRLDAQ